MKNCRRGLESIWAAQANILAERVYMCFDKISNAAIEGFYQVGTALFCTFCFVFWFCIPHSSLQTKCHLLQDFDFCLTAINWKEFKLT